MRPPPSQKPEPHRLQRDEGCAACEVGTLQAIIDAIPAPIFFKDTDGIYRGCNAAFEEVLGLHRSRILGHGVEDVAPPDLAAIYRRADDELLAAEGTQIYETSVRNAAGERRDVVFHKAVFRDRAGAVAGLVGTYLDITERKRAEQALRESEHQRVVADRLAALGTLAAGAAHEINNPLACVRASLDFAATQLAEPASLEDARASVAAAREALADAGAGVDRAARIVKDLRVFSLPADEDALVDAAAVAASALQVVRAGLRAHAVRAELAPVPPVAGDPARLGQVVVNLLVNAAQALPAGGGEIRLSTAVAPDGRVCVAVADTGAGIAPDDLPRIFEPFFTTRAPGGGSGLGLFVSHRLVAAMSGEIAVETEVGRGSTFRVLLPAVPPVAPGPAPG